MSRIWDSDTGALHKKGGADVAVQQQCQVRGQGQRRVRRPRVGSCYWNRSCWEKVNVE